MNHSRSIEKVFCALVGLGVCKLGYDHYSIRKFCDEITTSFKVNQSKNSQINSQYNEFIAQIKKDDSFKDSYKFEKDRVSYRKKVLNLLSQTENLINTEEVHREFEKKLAEYNFLIKWIDKKKIRETRDFGIEVCNSVYYSKSNYKSLKNKLEKKYSNDFQIGITDINNFIHDYRSLSNFTKWYSIIWKNVCFIEPQKRFRIQPNYYFLNGAELLGYSENIEPIDTFLSRVDSSKHPYYFRSEEEEENYIRNSLWYTFLNGMETVPTSDEGVKAELNGKSIVKLTPNLKEKLLAILKNHKPVNKLDEENVQNAIKTIMSKDSLEFNYEAENFVLPLGNRDDGYSSGGGSRGPGYISRGWSFVKESYGFR